MPKTYFFDNVKRFFLLNKTLLIWICVVILLGITTGIFCALKSNVELSLCNLQDFTLRNLFLCHYSYFAYIFIKTIILVLLLGCIFLISFLGFGSFLLFGLMLYLSYLLGIDIVVIVSIFGLLKGILLAILGLFVWQIIIYFAIFIFGYKMICFNRQLKLYGNCLLHGYEFKVFLFFIILLSVIIIFQTIFIWLICKIFVF